jgi:membrane protease YdiL (CAAX protease family)
MISAIDRKRIFIFVAIAYAAYIVVALAIFVDGGLFSVYPTKKTPLAEGLMTLVMFAPAMANLATRVITGEGFSNTLLRPNLRRGWPLYLAALFLPALAILAGGGMYYLLFPSQFDPSMTFARDELGMIAVLGATDPWLFLIVQTACVIASSLLSVYLMVGEEFGWRAYLQQKFMPLGPRKAMLLVGVIWAVWHWPAIFLGFNYLSGYWGAPVVGALLWVWTLLPVSVFYGWLTLRSGSVWPAAIAHGVNNASCGLALWFLRGPLDIPMLVLIGPSTAGIIGSLGWVVLGLVLFLSPRALAQPQRVPEDRTLTEDPGAMRQAPDQPELGTAS